MGALPAIGVWRGRHSTEVPTKSINLADFWLPSERPKEQPAQQKTPATTSRRSAPRHDTNYCRVMLRLVMLALVHATMVTSQSACADGDMQFSYNGTYGTLAIYFAGSNISESCSSIAQWGQFLADDPSRPLTADEVCLITIDQLAPYLARAPEGAGITYVRDVCSASCGMCPPPPPPSTTSPCVDADMNWNGIFENQMALTGVDESCAGLSQWTDIFSLGSIEATCAQDLAGFAAGMAGFGLVWAPPVDTYDRIGDVCAKSCNYAVCPPTPPTLPPEAPPPPALCGSAEHLDAIMVTDISLDGNLRDKRLQAGDARAQHDQDGSNIDRSQLHVFTAAVGMCGNTCRAAYEFGRLTGINVTGGSTTLCYNRSSYSCLLYTSPSPRDS